MGRGLGRTQREKAAHCYKCSLKRKIVKKAEQKGENRNRQFSARRRSEKSRSFPSSGTSQGSVVFLVDVSLKIAFVACGFSGA